MAFGKFLIRRIAQGVFVVWGVVTITFALRALSPGDPVNLVAGQVPDEATRQQIRQDLGLDQPISVQYFTYLSDLLTGNLGFSYNQRRSVNDIIAQHFAATVELAVAATVVAIVIAIPLGVVSATRRDEPADYAATLGSLVGISTPNFWLGIMLILIVAMQVGFLPTSGRGVAFHEAMYNLFRYGYAADLVSWLSYITLPAITLGTYFTALITRLTRSGMVDELGKPYVTATEAKGLPETLIRYKHVLRNTLIPIITVLGLQLGTLMGGAVITEEVFNWPGLGQMFITSLRNGDWPVVQGIVLFIAVAFVVINIFVDALYARLNPQVTDK
ncbi:ABC transporter permease [Natrarchaeobaculum sulfurireducens]|uniref:ABC-type dipeptide/oligopeptide/nickel transportsystem, permease component n=1 Tax=Natrarchaeobaculum sulfurireducens TaxID=2044521 RepID=A0A346PE00_9EURY|nr:ABC transporter permease [Natrarchaeobaculum sulfurireducens]AXR77745.1 ABC-type dipeptide/oligopeptide/nickel transportsystem, permease component [Natrarchaeobaculum sulfurireducens]